MTTNVIGSKAREEHPGKALHVALRIAPFTVPPRPPPQMKIPIGDSRGFPKSRER